MMHSQSATTIATRVDLLRQRMKKEGLDFYLISSSDPHHNEYVPPTWQWRAFISGFTGSNGHVCITQHEALLWTDSRYFIEAEQAIFGTPFRLMKIGSKQDLSLEDYLKKNAKQSRIGLDADQWTIDAFKNLEEAVSGLDVTWNMELGQLLEEIWDTRPPLQTTPIQVLEEQYTGRSVAEKLSDLRTQMRQRGAFYHVISHLDAIAWLLNIRALDIPYNPLCISYLIVGLNKIEWFASPPSCTAELRKMMDDHGIVLHPYAHFKQALSKLSEPVWVDPQKTSIMQKQVLKSCAWILKPSSIDFAKACKNKMEQEGMRKAHVADGIAMAYFMDWLYREGAQKTETFIAQVLESMRQKAAHYRGPSFQTISGFGPHGAIVHYSAKAGKDALVEAHNLFLLDSGGQYLGGTTDITRVFHLGQSTAEMKRHYTRVLKGHIALSRVVFPEGTLGSALDVLARFSLWEEGLDFGHGTGHGVGCYLSVHEGPIGISPRAKEPLRVGMILSNEPGYYRTDHYGIRIENLMLVVPHPTFPNFLQFETLTLCPYETKLIDVNLLTDAEKVWIDQYHARVRETLKPCIQDQVVLESLTRFTAPLVA